MQFIFGKKQQFVSGGSYLRQNGTYVPVTEYEVQANHLKLVEVRTTGAGNVVNIYEASKPQEPENAQTVSE